MTDAASTTDMSVEHETLLQFLYMCPNAMAQIDRHGTIAMLNPAFSCLAMPLVPPGETLGNVVRLFDAILPELGDVLRDPNGRGTICDNWLAPIGAMSPGQPDRVLSLSVVRITLDRQIVVLSDVTERVRLERERDQRERNLQAANLELQRLNQTIGRSEKHVRQLIEGMPNGVAVTNAEGRIEMVNAEAERLFGYSRTELVGLPVDMLLPVGSRHRHGEYRAGFTAAPTPRSMGAGRRLFALRKDGSQVEVEIRLSPIETPEGMMVLSTIVDITDRVLLEAQLRQSQKMDAIGRVAAGVAHDFNNLLMALGGSLEMMLDTVADRHDAVAWVEVALRAAARGKELTNRLLSFSRKQVLTTQAIPVAPLFAELQTLVSHLFQTNTRSRTELVIVPCDPDLTALADPAQLEAALINLAVNARDAMELGGCLRISAYAADADPAFVGPGRYAVISVADTGCGMDADTVARACEPFFTTKGVNGTGLGLSMVQGFARQSGGEAHITSVVGQGTTIDLWLPLAGAAATAPVPLEAPRPTGGRVLLVDDSPDALLVIAAFLRVAGMDVTKATSGDLALAKLAAGERFDVLITDFSMPGMNGCDLLASAREIDPSMAGMIVTGFSDPGLLVPLHDTIVLRKPFNRAELTEAVRSLIATLAAAKLRA